MHGCTPGHCNCHRTTVIPWHQDPKVIREFRSVLENRMRVLLAEASEMASGSTSFVERMREIGRIAESLAKIP